MRRRVELCDLPRAAYLAFMDFTEAQTMWWELTVDEHGVYRATDHGMLVIVRWNPAAGEWR